MQVAGKPSQLHDTATRFQPAPVETEEADREETAEGSRGVFQRARSTSEEGPLEEPPATPEKRSRTQGGEPSALLPKASAEEALDTARQKAEDAFHKFKEQQGEAQGAKGPKVKKERLSKAPASDWQSGALCAPCGAKVSKFGSSPCSSFRLHTLHHNASDDTSTMHRFTGFTP